MESNDFSTNIVLYAYGRTITVYIYCNARRWKIKNIDFCFFQPIYVRKTRLARKRRGRCARFGTCKNGLPILCPETVRFLISNTNFSYPTWFGRQRFRLAFSGGRSWISRDDGLCAGCPRFKTRSFADSKRYYQSYSKYSLGFLSGTSFKKTENFSPPPLHDLFRRRFTGRTRRFPPSCPVALLSGHRNSVKRVVEIVRIFSNCPGIVPDGRRE